MLARLPFPQRQVPRIIDKLVDIVFSSIFATGQFTIRFLFSSLVCSPVMPMHLSPAPFLVQLNSSCVAFAFSCDFCPSVMTSKKNIYLLVRSFSVLP